MDISQSSLDVTHPVWYNFMLDIDHRILEPRLNILSLYGANDCLHIYMLNNGPNLDKYSMAIVNNSSTTGIIRVLLSLSVLLTMRTFCDVSMCDDVENPVCSSAGTSVMSDNISWAVAMLYPATIIASSLYKLSEKARTLEIPNA